MKMEHNKSNVVYYRRKKKAVSPSEILKSSYEQYEPSCIVCGKCSRRTNYNDKYCPECGSKVDRSFEIK